MTGKRSDAIQAWPSGMTPEAWLAMGREVLALQPFPVLIGAELTAPDGGRSQAVCRCDVYAVRDGEEKLCAVAQVTIARRGDDRS